MASLELVGIRATAANAWFPRTGLWVVDFQFEGPEAAALRGKVNGSLLGSSLRGEIDPLFTGTFRTRGRVRLVGGAGWHKSLPARSYHNDAGVKASYVASTTATECGEEVDGTINGRLNSDYVRSAGTARRALDALFSLWRVDLDGRTRTGDRAQVEVSTGAAFDVLDYSPEQRQVKLALDTLILPGSVIRDRLDKPFLVRAIELEIAGSQARAMAWGIEL